MKDWDEMTKKEQLEFQSRSGWNSTAEEVGAFLNSAGKDQAKRQLIVETGAALDAGAAAKAAMEADPEGTVNAVAAVDARATAEAAAAVDQEAIFAVAAKLAGMTLDQYKKILKLGNGGVS